MACSGCSKKQENTKTFQAKGIEPKQGDVTIVKTFIADVDVLIDAQGRRFVKKK